MDEHSQRLKINGGVEQWRRRGAHSAEIKGGAGLAAEPSLVAAREERDGARWRRSGAWDCYGEEERCTIADAVEKSGGAQWLRWRGTAVW
jgi:hypothetical protein